VRQVQSGAGAQRFRDLTASSNGVPAGKAGPVVTGTSALSSWTGTFHGYWGAFPSGVTLTGAQATQSLNPSAQVGIGPSGSSDTIFAPTLDPSSIDCIEMSTIYANGQVQVGALDWCAANPSFAKIAPVNSAFLSTYTTTVNGHPVYSVQDVQTNPATNQWTAYLYNYATNAWDTFYQSASTSKLGSTGGGWDIMEVLTYYNPATGEGQYCSQAPGAVFQTTGLQYQTTYGGVWTPATTANSSFNLSAPKPSDLGCSDLNYTVTTPNSAFSVTNPPVTAAAVPGTVQAANYDTGGQGVAYNVTSVNGTAGIYRPDGVDLEATADTQDTTPAGGAYDLGWTTGGQWFKYTVNVATAGTYTVSLRLASPNGVTDALHIANSAGTSLSGSVSVPDTGGWQDWTTVTATVTLPAGPQTLTIDQDNAGWNIHYLTFTASGSAPFAGTPAAVPGTVQAANYDTPARMRTARVSISITNRT
jgi:hypothetical protein